MDSEPAQAQLVRWGISESVAASAGLFDVQDVSSVFDGMPAEPGIIIPYWRRDGRLLTYPLGGEERPFGRVRWLADKQPAGFVKRKPIRYTQPRHTGPQVYYPPVLDWQAIAADIRAPLVVTEGEAKALAGAQHGFNVMALGGVFSFTTAGGRLLPELADIEWKLRNVYVVFDSDAATNPNVLAAEARLVHELQGLRGAHCHVVRLPAAGDEKMGLDDFLKAEGPTSLEALLQSAPALSGLDAKIINMNQAYAWIEREAMIYDLESRLFIRKDSFTSGSLASSVKHIVVGGPKSSPKEVPVAQLWLKHPHAQRYNEILFRPGEGRTLHGEHGTALNMFDEFQAEPGNVEPWLRLNEFIFSRVEREHRDLALKLMAYKAQNPAKKVPLAVVLIGTQGSGKTVWADAIRDAFDPYSANPNPTTLNGEFQGFLETSLIATIHEITPEQIKRSAETLKALISDLRRPMNEKYRPVREINSYTSYIITSNSYGVGAYAADDRRMFVVDTPGVGPEELYNAVWAWREAGGGRHLMHYLLTYDLKGWTPPQRAPMTVAKAMASREEMTQIQHLAEQMQAADHNVIVYWLDAALAWATAAELSNNSAEAGRARAVTQSIRTFQIRPFYTPEELSMMFPAIVETLAGSKFNRSTPAGQVSRELREAGVPYLRNKDDVRGFAYGGRTQQFLVVADFEEWDHPITQADFDRALREFPTYGQLKGGRKP